MKRELTLSEVLFNFSCKEGEDKGELKNIPPINSFYKKIEKAISITDKSYNLFIIDKFSEQRLQEMIECIEKTLSNTKPPSDICYVIDEDKNKPKAIYVENGYGKKLKSSIKNIKDKYYDVCVEFYNASSDEEKDKLIEEVSIKRSKYMDELIDMASEESFEIKTTKSGFAFVPLRDGEIMTEDEYDKLSDSEKDLIIIKASELKDKAEIILDKIKKMELIALESLKKIYKRYIESIMEEEKQDLLLEFIEDENAYNFLERLFDIIEAKLIEEYTLNLEDDEKNIEKILKSIDINVLVDNSNKVHFPIIYEEDPTPSNLFGNVEYENKNGIYYTDLSLISAGSILKANEGVLIIRINQLLNNPISYNMLKKSLMSKKVNIDGNKSILELITTNSFKGESIPINVKVILIGSYEIYNLLINGDEDFKQLFNEVLQFPEYIEVKNNENVIKDYIIARFKKYGIHDISNMVILEIMRYLCRAEDNKYRMNIDMDILDDLIIKIKNNIENETLSDIFYPKSYIQKEIISMYQERKMVLSLVGKKIGTINGLAVISTNSANFGKPIRINCVCGVGNGNIIDVQKESSLSGNIHIKSINIIKGLLSNEIWPYKKLTVDFYVSFEQVYGTIDGDSATVAEYLAILSSISKIPIKQNIAVTGSLNLMGEVQPIGGVKEKIEGFYDVCMACGVNSGINVLIPETNINELILLPEVEECVKTKRLHIFSMKNIKEAIEITMGVSYEEVLEKIRNNLKKYL